MTAHRTDIERLAAEARPLPDGPVKVALLEEAVRLADFAGDVERAFELRQHLLDAATFSGRPDIGLVAFAWCLAEFDRNPDKYDQASLLWKYKWVVDTPIDFPMITQAQMKQLSEDMARRFHAFGAPHAAVCSDRYLAVWTGRHDDAIRFDEQLSLMSRDALSNCPACLVRARLEFLVETEQHEAAVAYFKNEVTPATRCKHEPHRILAGALRSFWRLGDLATAQGLHERGYKMISRDQTFTQYWGYHIAFPALTDQPAAVRRLIQRHTEQGLRIVSLQERHEFLIGVVIGLKRLAHDGVKTMKLTTSEPLDVPSSSKGYDVAALADWFLRQATDIAESFDRRNGNDYFRKRLKARCADLEFAIARGDKID